MYDFSAELLDGNGEVVGDAATATLTIVKAATFTELSLDDPSRPTPADGPITASDDPSDARAQTVMGTVAGEHGTTPAGSVEIAVGDELLDTVELDGAGDFTWTVPASSTETAIQVRFLGDANNEPSDVTITVPGVEDPVDPDEPTDPPTHPDDPSAPGGPPEDPASPAPDADLATTGAAIGLAVWAALGAIVTGLALLLTRRTRAS